MSGLEPYGRSAALEFLLSPLSGAHVALLETLPVYGVGAVEIGASGYARQPAVNWISSSITGLPSVSSRCNDDTIAFGPYFDDVKAKGWAIYDALTGGNLIASGAFVDAGYGQAGIITIQAGDDVQFQVGDLCLSLSQDCPIVVASSPLVNCPVPAIVTVTLPTLTVLNVPVGGSPIPIIAGTGLCFGEITTDIAFDGADYTSEFFFGAVSQGPMAAGPGPAPHTQWSFSFTAPLLVGTIVHAVVTKTAEPACTFSQNFTTSTSS